MKIAILGWGSLLWDKRADFDDQHSDWKFDGPHLKLEFSRVSQTRNDALTLVLDTTNGKLCQVAYTFSKRKNPDDAISDLRCREGTTLDNIGFYFSDGSRKQSRDVDSLKAITAWASSNKIDVVIWTGLSSNFKERSKCKADFSVENALCHLQEIDAEGKAKAAEYVWRAPGFIRTPLREALHSQPWFPKHDQQIVPGK